MREADIRPFDNKRDNLNDLKTFDMKDDICIGSYKSSTRYHLIRVPDRVHSIGGRYGNNDYYIYDRRYDDIFENKTERYHNITKGDALIAYSGVRGALWDIKTEHYQYIKTKYDETECRCVHNVTIMRNFEEFFTVHSIDEARYLINRLNEHPLELNEYNFDKNVVGRKVWYRSQEAIIERFINNQACVILVPDTNCIKEFSIPKEYQNDDFPIDDEYKEWIKADIFDSHIYWFRD